MRHGTFPRAVAVTAVALILGAGTALSAIRIGTDNAETLTGTNGNDQLTGKGGDDTLKGLAGDDVYDFKDGWGSDTLEEKARYKVGDQKVPGGSDTLSFRGVTGGPVDVRLIHQWGPIYNRAYGPGGEIVNLDASVVENVVGTGASQDVIVGGGEKNTLQPGGGGAFLYDRGGYDDGPGGKPELPASNDTFKGLTQSTGTVFIIDWGGTADVLDLRPFAAGDVYLDRIDLDSDASGTEESLQIVTGGSNQVLVAGHFGALLTQSAYGQHGRIERLVFADGTFSGASDVSGASLSGKKLTAKQQKLAKAAPGLAKEARRLANDASPPGEPPDRR